MKKRILCILICILLLPCTFAHALIDPDLPRVVDEAGLLSSSEISDLNNTIDDLITNYQMDIVIVTTANSDEEARELLTQFGMPFQK